MDEHFLTWIGKSFDYDGLLFFMILKNLLIVRVKSVLIEAKSQHGLTKVFCKCYINIHIFNSLKLKLPLEISI